MWPRLFRGRAIEGTTTRDGPSLRHVAAEFAIVVAGILVALAGLYAAHQTPFPLVEHMQGHYPSIVYERVPAQLQAQLNSMKGHACSSTAPVIADDADFARVIESARARRAELPRLARSEAATACGALTTMPCSL